MERKTEFYERHKYALNDVEISPYVTVGEQMLFDDMIKSMSNKGVSSDDILKMVINELER